MGELEKDVNPAEQKRKTTSLAEYEHADAEPSPNASDYMTLDEFCSLFGADRGRILKMYRQIPGIERRGRNDYRVLKGTRLPFSLKGQRRQKTNAKCVELILRAIDLRQYIGAERLGMYQESFEQILDELLKAGFIRLNTMPNRYGTNGYDPTLLADQQIQEIRTRKAQVALNAIAEASGHAAAGFYDAWSR